MADQHIPDPAERAGLTEADLAIATLVGRYRIAWDDGHESIYTPAAGALHAERTSGATAS